eukprot:476232_1
MMASRRRKNRKCKVSNQSNTIQQELISPQDVINCIMNNYSSLLLNLNDINIGLQTDNKSNDTQDIETKEITFNKFENSNTDAIIYLNMKVKSIPNNKKSNVILYDKRSEIDRITGSGNTKKQQLWTEIRRKYIDKNIIKQSLQKHKKQIIVKKQQIKTTNNQLQEEQKIDMNELKDSNDTNIININIENKITIRIEPKLKTNLIKLSRNDCASIASETVSIAKKGYYKIYKSGTDKQINIGSVQYKAQNNAILYHHNDNLYKFCDFNSKKTKYNLFNNMKIEIINQTTLNGCYELAMDVNISNPVALNFASARNPGGGFLKGSNAQEESIARNSGLYHTLIKYEKEFYEYHKYHCKSMLYSHSMIYSPNVPIFRDDNSNLLNNYYMSSFISSPAVNCKQFMRKCGNGNNKHKNDGNMIVLNTMKYRIDKILDIAVKYNHDSIILGAFGCGVFGNDASVVSDLFGMLLSTKYKFRFKRIRFSILKMKENDKTFTQFVEGIKKHFI